MDEFNYINHDHIERILTHVNMCIDSDGDILKCIYDICRTNEVSPYEDFWAEHYVKIAEGMIIAPILLNQYHEEICRSTKDLKKVIIYLILLGVICREESLKIFQGYYEVNSLTIHDSMIAPKGFVLDALMRLYDDDHNNGSLVSTCLFLLFDVLELRSLSNPLKHIKTLSRLLEYASLEYFVDNRYKFFSILGEELLEQDDLIKLLKESYQGNFV